MSRRIPSRISRWKPSRLLERAVPKPAEPPASDANPCDTVRLAEEIGMEALDMAKRAQEAGLPTLGFLLEAVALEASAQADAARWPSDASER